MSLDKRNPLPHRITRSAAFWLALLGLLVWPQARALADEPKPAQVKALVKAGVACALREGQEATVSAVNDPRGPLTRRSLRLFALDLETGVLLADPLRPGLAGKPVLDLIDAKGKAYYKVLADMARDQGSGWSDHFIVPPGGKYADIEAVYVERVPDSSLILGCGMFDMDALTAEAQSGN